MAMTIKVREVATPAWHLSKLVPKCFLDPADQALRVHFHLAIGTKYSLSLEAATSGTKRQV